VHPGGSVPAFGGGAASRLRIGLAEHLAIVDAVCGGNPQAADTAMRTHLLSAAGAPDGRGPRRIVGCHDSDGEHEMTEGETQGRSAVVPLTFVLLHGAWHGGWVWRDVARLLRAGGHQVLSPTLTGVSDRAHVLTPAVGLDTHIEDVVSLLDAEDVTDAVLVGHSYAGQVVTGVADARPARLRRRIYLDAFAGEDGESAIDLQPADVAGHYRESVAANGFGWLIPVRPLDRLGITRDEDKAWLQPRLTPHPWRTYTQPLRVAGRQHDVPSAYIECTAWMRVFRAQAERAKSQGWESREIVTGHEAMVTAPGELAALLAELAV
jgi:pimeloyl-ACP methyl ester carboxylesterase